MIISLIVAADENNVIGSSNKLLWHLPDDMKHFRELTKGHPVIMGRKTFESIGKPLPNRRNIIISHRKDYKVEGCDVVDSLVRAYELIGNDVSGEAFVIGGGEIYRQAMDRADRIYLTRVHSEFVGDTYFPEVDSRLWVETDRKEHPADVHHAFPLTFLTFERRPATDL